MNDSKKTTQTPMIQTLPPQKIRPTPPNSRPPPPPISTLPKATKRYQYQENRRSFECSQYPPAPTVAPPLPPSLMIPPTHSNGSGFHISAPTTTAVRCAGPPPPPLPPSLPVESFTAIPVSAHSDPRDALMNSILNGTKLRSVENNVENQPAAANPCARDDLLKNIREGVALKKSAPKPDKNGMPAQITRTCNDPLAMALLKALENRKNAIQHSDDENECSEDEWE